MNEPRKAWPVWLKVFALGCLAALVWLWMDPDLGPLVVAVITIPLVIAAVILGLGTLVYRRSTGSR